MGQIQQNQTLIMLVVKCVLVFLFWDLSRYLETGYAYCLPPLSVVLHLLPSFIYIPYVLVKVFEFANFVSRSTLGFSPEISQTIKPTDIIEFLNPLIVFAEAYCLGMLSIYSKTIY